MLQCPTGLCLGGMKAKTAIKRKTADNLNNCFIEKTLMIKILMIKNICALGILIILTDERILKIVRK